MARFSAAARSTGAGSTTLPLESLYSPAGSGFYLREIGVFNTTATALAIALVRESTAGTPGAAITAVKHDNASPAAVVTPVNTHTVGPTLGAPIRSADLGAAIGAGVIWTFYDNAGLIVPIGTANGLGIVILTGTGQICDIYWTWDE